MEVPTPASSSHRSDLAPFDRTTISSTPPSTWSHPQPAHRTPPCYRRQPPPTPTTASPSPKAAALPSPSPAKIFVRFSSPWHSASAREKESPVHDYESNCLSRLLTSRKKSIQISSWPPPAADDVDATCRCPAPHRPTSPPPVTETSDDDTGLLRMHAKAKLAAFPRLERPVETFTVPAFSSSMPLSPPQCHRR